jgi:hypothetical protein
MGEALRSYLPLDSPLGFGAADWIALALAIVGLVVFAWLRPQPSLLNPFLNRISAFLTTRSPWFFFVLTLLLRLILLHSHPVPIPSGADDFGYLLLGDTFSHGRWTNPSHPNSAFFETVFVLQHPTYSSIFPPGQGIILALGQLIFGVPWVGVLLSMSLLAALCHWMLSGWLNARWASVGALLATFTFGPLCAWMNCYWGGASAAIAGCLVFGSLARLRHSQHSFFALTAGLGLGWHVLSRPFETIFLIFSVVLYWALFLRTPQASSLVWRRGALFALGTAPALGVLLIQSHAVTGHWTKLPYSLSREQYGVPTTFAFQANPIPAHQLTQEQKNDYDAQSVVHGEGHETLSDFVTLLLYRLRFLRFFVYAPFYLALFLSLFKWRDKTVIWAASTIVLFFVGTNVYPYFYPHYVAALTGVVLLLTVSGIRSLNAGRAGPWGVAWLLALCAFQFGFWYCVQMSGVASLILGTGRFETWDYVNFGDPQGRLQVESKLSHVAGRQLVFVRYSSTHGLETWIANPADIDHVRVVRAVDVGPSDDLALIRRFPGRTVWLLRPDFHPPNLTPYPYLLDDLMLMPKPTPAPSTSPTKPRNSNKISDWLEDVK